MENKRKIAFFDFCETLANFQTADAFVDYVREQTQSKRMRRLEDIRNFCIHYKVFSIIGRITRYKYPIFKISKLYQLKGFKRDELEYHAQKYYHEVIKQNFITELIDILKQKKNDGYEIVLVSGGYDIYLKYFAAEFGVDNIISSRIKFKRDKCLGILWGLDCLSYNKVILLNSQYHPGEIVSEAYSDSVSAKPFLSWANIGYVVSKNKSQNWVTNSNFKEIIW